MQKAYKFILELKDARISLAIIHILGPWGGEIKTKQV